MTSSANVVTCCRPLSETGRSVAILNQDRCGGSDLVGFSLLRGEAGLP